MSEITAEEVRRVARLARLHLSDDEVAKYAVQLGQIVSMIRGLDEVATEGIEAMEHIAGLSNVMGEDAAEAGLDREASLGNAPKRDEVCFLVPAVMGNGGRSS